MSRNIQRDDNVIDLSISIYQKIIRSKIIVCLIMLFGIISTIIIYDKINIISIPREADEGLLIITTQCFVA
ncbi:MAG: hypothetical protein M3Z01_00675 [Thermoproteota archaeon]|nr:hypothetical protein [Thermoproteota archaeon]